MGRVTAALVAAAYCIPCDPAAASWPTRRPYDHAWKSAGNETVTEVLVQSIAYHHQPSTRKNILRMNEAHTATSSYGKPTLSHTYGVSLTCLLASGSLQHGSPSCACCPRCRCCGCYGCCSCCSSSLAVHKERAVDPPLLLRCESLMLQQETSNGKPDETWLVACVRVRRAREEYGLSWARVCKAKLQVRAVRGQSTRKDKDVTNHTNNRININRNIKSRNQVDLQGVRECIS